MSMVATDMKLLSQQKFVIRSGSMVGKYDVKQVIELLFDNKFGLCDGEINEEESGDTYCY